MSPKMVYGYRVNTEYLKGVAEDLGFIRPGHEGSDRPYLYIADTAYELLRLAGFSRRGLLGSIYLNKDRADEDYALIIASNDPSDGLPLRPPPQEDIDRLRTLLNLDVNPRWWPSADDE